jgi:hypothetical protein
MRIAHGTLASFAQALARKATAPATLRAYKADWAHFPKWCAEHSFTPVPRRRRQRAPTSPAWPTTMRRPPSAGASQRWAKCTGSTICRWNPAHPDIQGALQGTLRTAAARC